MSINFHDKSYAASYSPLSSKPKFRIMSFFYFFYLPSLDKIHFSDFTSI